MAVPVDPVSVESLFALVARALVWHHWKAYFTSDHEAQVLMLTRAGSEFFASRFFSMASANRVHESLGNDTVSYEGIQGIDLPQVSVWRFKFYGGLSFAGDPRAPGESSTEIGVVTGPKRILKPSLTASGFRITR
jgi:hypothetical protein